MIATLVMNLPTAHTCGELVIDDVDQQKTYRASRTALSLTAFYADRLHEVLPVKFGHRIALTFNLMSQTPAAAFSPDQVSAVAKCLSDYFATHVFHEYTQRSLSLGQLKGSDTERLDTLQVAAQTMGYQASLAQLDIQEMGETESAADDYPRWGSVWDDEDEEYGENDAGTTRWAT